MTAHFLALSVALAAFLALAMAAAFAVRLATGKSGWIDTIWSAAVGLAALAAITVAPGDPTRRIVLACLVAAWSLRLAGHIAGRTRGAGDDPRYTALVDGWGATWRRSLFVFLQAQAAAGLVLVAAVAIAAADPARFGRLADVFGVVVALAGLGLEGLADRQLRRWRRGRRPDAPPICDVGLWGVSRHPNYLGEILWWTAWPLLAFDPARPWGALLAAAAPALMARLLVAVSGIPPLEAHMRKSRGAAWDAYRRRVPPLIPFTRADDDRSPSSR